MPLAPVYPPEELAIDRFFNFPSLQALLKEPLEATAPVWTLLEKMNRVLQQKKSWSIRCKVPQGVYLVDTDHIDIDESCLLEPGSYIQGPCILGPGTQVRHGAYIRGQVVTGKDCVIGHTSEFKNVLFLDGAKAGHFAYVGDAIIGIDVNLGAGVKCANFRLDHQPIAITYQGQRYATGYRKLGAILGDGCQVGCNSVLNPGTLVGPQSHIWPLVNLFGVWPMNSVIKK